MKTDLQVISQDPITGRMMDVSQLVTSASWETTLMDQPGRFKFSYIDIGRAYFPEGTRIAATLNGIGMFSGFVFTRERTHGDIIQVTAYDQMRYLSNTDVANFPAMTSRERFLKICTDQGLVHTDKHGTTELCAPKLYENKSYFEMIQDAIDETLILSGIWYMVRDNFGILEHVNLTQLLTPVVIGDESLLTGFSFKSTIDGETYNSVKLTRDNEETGKRDVYIAMDGDNITRWGLLQFYQSVDSKLNEAQIIERANTILELKNRPTRSLKLECIGDVRVRAGNGVTLNISQLQNEEIPQNQSALIFACTHGVTGGVHVMSLDMEIV